MSDKCFCHFNGYEVKDARARRDIEHNKSIIEEQNNNAEVKLWVGSQEEYNNISAEDKVNNCIYLTTGPNVLFSDDSTGVGAGATIEIPDIDKYSLFAIKVRNTLGECMIVTGKGSDMLGYGILSGVGYLGGSNGFYFKVSCTIIDTSLNVRECEFSETTTFTGNANAYICGVIGIV